MSTEIEFHYGGLCDSLEKQAKKQGYTFGKDAKWVEKVSFGLTCAYIHGCITDSERDRILRKFQTKVLMPRLKKLDDEEG